MLPADSRLERIHSDRYDADQFNPTVPAPDGGGRFDSAKGDYAYLYAGADISTAVEETLLRDLPVPADQPRRIPMKVLEGAMLSVLTSTEKIPLTDLRSSGALAALGQDSWLVHCESSDYPLTREWASTIREWDTEAAGFVWKSRRTLDTDAYVLFEDRLGPGLVIPRGEPMPIASGLGRELIDGALRRAKATVG